MTQEQLITAINQTAQDLGLKSWQPITSNTHIPSAMTNIASVAWAKQFPENENTILIREQISILWKCGKLKFD